MLVNNFGDDWMTTGKYHSREKTIALDEDNSEVQLEASRALGNLATNVDYSFILMKNDVLRQLIVSLTNENNESQRVVAMALSNIASDIKTHCEIIAYLYAYNYILIMFSFI